MLVGCLCPRSGVWVKKGNRAKVMTSDRQQGAIEALRRQVAAIEAASEMPRAEAGERVPLDGGAVDAALGGGLARGRLHEILPEAVADAPAAAGFALALALRIAGAGVGPLFWIRAEMAAREFGRPHADGLAALGCDPKRLFLVRLADPLSILRAGVEVARCPAIGAVIVELQGDPKALDLTTERRLTLAAGQSGVSVLLLRPGARGAPGGSETRWRLRSGPARALPMNAPGPPTFDLTLLRHRHGPPGGPWRLEWNRDEQRFVSPPLLRDPDARPRLEPAAQPAAGALRRRAS